MFIGIFIPVGFIVITVIFILITLVIFLISLHVYRVRQMYEGTTNIYQHPAGAFQTLYLNLGIIETTLSFLKKNKKVPLPVDKRSTDMLYIGNPLNFSKTKIRFNHIDNQDYILDISPAEFTLPPQLCRDVTITLEPKCWTVSDKSSFFEVTAFSLNTNEKTSYKIQLDFITERSVYASLKFVEVGEKIAKGSFGRCIHTSFIEVFLGKKKMLL